MAISHNILQIFQNIEFIYEDLIYTEFRLSSEESGRWVILVLEIDRSHPDV